MHDRSNYTA